MRHRGAASVGIFECSIVHIRFAYYYIKYWLYSFHIVIFIVGTLPFDQCSKPIVLKMIARN